MKNRAGTVNIICGVLCIVLAGVLIFLFYTEKQKEKVQSSAVSAAQEEAAPYEKELKTLQSELSDLEDGISYASEESEMMVGFVVSASTDCDYIAEKASAYGFSPVLVIDCTMDASLISDIIEAADDSWEIMLYASTFSDKVNEQVLSVISYLGDKGIDHTGIFFLRSGYTTESNIQMLQEDGFTGYTVYHSDSPEAGQTEDGIVYFDYSYLSASGTNVTGRLSAMYSDSASMIFTFDMNSIHEQTLTEAYVTELLELLQSYDEKDDCSFSTVADVVEELSGINSVEAENQAEYESRAAEIQTQIDELEDTIDEIYSRLGGV